jgi:hypothetical protein
VVGSVDTEGGIRYHGLLVQSVSRDRACCIVRSSLVFNSSNMDKVIRECASYELALTLANYGSISRMNRIMYC